MVVAQPMMGNRMPMQRVSSSFFPNSATVLPYNNGPRMMPMPMPMPMLSQQPAYPPPPPPPRPSPSGPQPNLARMNSDDAMQLAMMLSEQEAQYGINMYDSLKPQDEPEIQTLIARGMTLEQAVYSIFERKFIRQVQGQGQAPSPPAPINDSGSSSQQPIPSMAMNMNNMGQQQQGQQQQGQQGPGPGMSMPGAQPAQQVLVQQRSFESEMTDDVSVNNLIALFPISFLINLHVGAEFLCG